MFNIKNFFKKALEKTKEVLQASFTAGPPEEMLAELEDRLILSDAGPVTAAAIIGEIRKRRPATGEDVRQALRVSLLARVPKSAAPLFAPAPPTVWFLLGTNGSGKTTTSAKLATYHQAQKMTVSLVAADTFRAAAVDQLRIWAGRAGAGFFAMQEGSQPAAVVFDALSDKKVRASQLVIVDTAGRLHTRTSLLEELVKMTKSCEKTAPGSLMERLLVIDGTSGQNALAQARTFHSSMGLTGLIVTKLDASAKAGFLLAMESELPGIPIKWIGMGEALTDISPFDAAAFIDGLVGEDPLPSGNA